MVNPFVVNLAHFMQKILTDWMHLGVQPHSPPPLLGSYTTLIVEYEKNSLENTIRHRQKKDQMTNATNKGLNILETSVLTPSINTFFYLLT